MRWSVAAIVLVTWFAGATAFATPRLSIAEARKVALARVPGKIVHEKLKTKQKGHDTYNFKIVPLTNPKLHFVEKVTVDGDTGKVLKVKQVADEPETEKKTGKQKPDPADDADD